MKLIKLSVFLLTMSCTALVAQETTPNVPTNANYVGKVDGMIYVPSLASRINELPPPDNRGEAKDKRSLGNTVVIGKDPQTEDDYFVRNRHKDEQSVQVRSTILAFDAYSSSSQPTDPSVAVGPNHVFTVFNTGFAIYDKTGTLLLGPLAPNPAIFPSSGCCDLTVSYDIAADRWVLSFLGSGAQVAVSDGPDPVTAGWYVYNISAISDYQKLSIWSDGYYMTNNTGATNKVWALERDQMLLGNASAQILGFDLPGIVTSGFYSPQFLSISGSTIPAAGGATIFYMQDDAWAGVSTDHIKIWTLDVDWGAGNGVISAATQVNITPFIGVFDGGSFSNLTQPGGGTAIDALQATVMNQAQFRKFSTHNSAVFNFVVDTDAGAGELAGVRWFEFRQTADNQPWTLYQEGTYTAPDGRHAWHASLIMDGSGNIGMGYTSMSGPTTSTTEYVSSYYTGRFDGDPLGVMTVAEGVIATGNANIPGTRYGDYSKICIDPADDATFWFINEYMNTTRRGVVGAFLLDAPLPDDIGVIAITNPNSGVLTATETIVVDIRNFGSNDITNPDVQYTINAGTPVVETYSGTIPAGATVQYTFTTQADLSTSGTTYTICAKTNLGGDSNVSNDEFCKDVTNGVVYCMPPSDCSFGDGITKMVLGSIVNNSIPCNTGYDDFTSMSTTLTAGNSYDMTVQTGYNATTEMASMWIDFNDDGVFAASEQVFADQVVNPDGVDVTINFTIPASSNLGTHIMRVRAGDTQYAGNLNDPCDSQQYGTTHDYTVVVDAGTGTSGITNSTLEASDMLISSKEDNQYDISLVTAFEGTVSIIIYNAAGEVMAFNNLNKAGDRYNYHLDMSYAAAGMYIIKMGDSSTNTFKMEKIVVE